MSQSDFAAALGAELHFRGLPFARADAVMGVGSAGKKIPRGDEDRTVPP